MDATVVNHYLVLGLPSGEESWKLSERQITTAFRSMAKKLHPDKRLSDPRAHANFLQLQASYQLLKDHNKRKLFDDDLRRQHADRTVKVLHHRQQQNDDDSKRRRMKSDLEEKENFDLKGARDREEEDAKIQKLKEEIAGIVDEHKRKATVERGKINCSVFDGLDERPRSTRSYNVAGFDVYEDSVLGKLRRAGQRQTQT